MSSKLVDIFPKLGPALKKGDNGCIGVIGGSFQYTGAPFYTAMTTLKVGADLSHIFCAKSAAIPIKSYSPEVIVHPVFTSSHQFEEELTKQKIEKLHDKWLEYIKKFFNKVNSWVIGPGLGRDDLLVSFFPKLIKSFPKKTFVTLDADGLYAFCQHPQLTEVIRQLNCVATPNSREFKHLNYILKIDTQISEQLRQDHGEISNKQIESLSQNNKHDFQDFYKQTKWINNFQLPMTVIRKGQIDEIYTKQGKKYIVWGEGSRKRCGGIGDVLSGCVGTFSFWNFQLGPLLACIICRISAKQAFQEEGRSLTAPKIVDAVGKVVKNIP